MSKRPVLTHNLSLLSNAPTADISTAEYQALHNSAQLARIQLERIDQLQVSVDLLAGKVEQCCGLMEQAVKKMKVAHDNPYGSLHARDDDGNPETHPGYSPSFGLGSRERGAGDDEGWVGR